MTDPKMQLERPMKEMKKKKMKIIRELNPRSCGGPYNNRGA
jgi:hypothetical protein